MEWLNLRIVDFFEIFLGIYFRLGCWIFYFFSWKCDSLILVKFLRMLGILLSLLNK